MCIPVCVIYICVWTHITVYFIQTIWEKEKEVLSHNHNNLWCNIVYNTFCHFRPDFSFVTCPNNVLYSILSFSARSHPVSRRAFPLEQFPSLSLLFMTWPFLKSSGQVFCRIGPQLGPAWCFLTDSGYTFSAAAPSTVCILRASHPRARACLPEVSWAFGYLVRALSGFSTAEFQLCPLQLINGPWMVLVQISTYCDG